MIQMKDHLCGFCLLFKKQLWKDLKGFDEKFMLYGQETDFITRAKELGYVNVWRQDAFVFHYGEASCKSSRINIDAARAYGRKLYNKKHNIKT
jgi:GT2 family glycosyltransferase